MMMGRMAIAYKPIPTVFTCTDHKMHKSTYLKPKDFRALEPLGSALMSTNANTLSFMLNIIISSMIRHNF